MSGRGHGHHHRSGDPARAVAVHDRQHQGGKDAQGRRRSSTSELTGGATGSRVPGERRSRSSTAEGLNWAKPLTITSFIGPEGADTVVRFPYR